MDMPKDTGANRINVRTSPELKRRALWAVEKGGFKDLTELVNFLLRRYVEDLEKKELVRLEQEKFFATHSNE
jgi:Arc/MetJ-type ribon-helix-helix transcriptional regulator